METSDTSASAAPSEIEYQPSAGKQTLLQWSLTFLVYTVLFSLQCEEEYHYSYKPAAL